jgi:O-antigen/teichoic acid export membrane protein
MDFNRSTFRLFLSKSGNAILYFAGITFFARQLSPDQLGAFFLFMTLRGLLSIPADLGISGAVEKRLSEGLDPESTLGSALAFKFITIAIVSLGIIVARTQVNAYIGAELALLLIAAIVTRDLSQFYIRVVRGELRAGETASIEFVRRSVWIATGVTLAAAGFGARGLAIGVTFGSGVGALFAYLKCDTAIGRPSLERTKSLIAFSKYQTVTSIGSQVYQWVDIAIIGYFLTQQAVSAYELSWQVTLLVLLVSNSIGKVVFPQFSQWNAQAATDRIEATLSKTIGVALFISIPALVGASVYASEVLGYVFGPEYTFAAGVLVVLMVEKLFQSVNDIIEGSVRAIDRPDLAAKATVLAIGVNLLLSPLLAVSIGLIGVAIATAISWFVSTALHTRFLSRFVSVDVPYRLVGWYTLSSLLMGASLFVLETIVPVTSLPLLVLEIGFGVAVYLAITTTIPDVRKRIIMPGIEVLRAQVR